MLAQTSHFSWHPKLYGASNITTPLRHPRASHNLAQSHNPPTKLTHRGVESGNTMPVNGDLFAAEAAGLGTGGNRHRCVRTVSQLQVTSYAIILLRSYSPLLKTLCRPSNKRIVRQSTPLGTWQTRGADIIILLADSAHWILDLRILKATF